MADAEFQCNRQFRKLGSSIQAYRPTSRECLSCQLKSVCTIATRVVGLSPKPKSYEPSTRKATWTPKVCKIIAFMAVIMGDYVTYFWGLGRHSFFQLPGSGWVFHLEGLHCVQVEGFQVLRYYTITIISIIVTITNILIITIIAITVARISELGSRCLIVSPEKLSKAVQGQILN